MKQRVPYILLGLAFCISALLIWGTESFSRKALLEEQVKLEREREAALRNKVTAMKRRIVQLTHDERFLEEVARQDLGMAGEDELIFVFNEPTDRNK